MFREAKSKSIKTIMAEWDRLAPIRLKQISSGEDITFNHILVPYILELLLGGHTTRSVLDAGCGIGALTSRLALEVPVVIGVDPSARSIKIARDNYGKKATFQCSTIEAYSEMNTSAFDVVVANMVLMDALDLRSFLEAARRTLRVEGRFVFSMTHPWYWPLYYGYVDQAWFRYEREIIVESPFRITSEPDCQLYSTHVHRPLAQYIETLISCGFIIERFLEPMPAPEINSMYANPWKFPRYIFISCRKAK